LLHSGEFDLVVSTGSVSEYGNLSVVVPYVHRILSDRGGVPELVKLIRTTKYPIIMTCNDVWQSKMSPIRAKSKLVEMKALPTATISALLQSVANKEKIGENIHFLNQIAIKSQGDIRAALNDLQSYSAGKDIFTIDMEEKRDVEESIFNILRKNIQRKRTIP